MVMLFLPTVLAAELVHVPPVEAAPGRALTLRVDTEDPAAMNTVVLYYRPIGTDDWRSLAFAREDEDTFSATIPGSEVGAPGLEYTIASPERAHFASTEAPQPVRVAADTALTRQDRELERYDGQRSTARASYDLNRWGDELGKDQTWSAEVDFTYRPLGTVRSLRFGVMRMRGSTIELDWTEAVESQPREAIFTEVPTGLDQGWAEVELPASERFAVKGRLMLGAQERFTAGAQGAVRIGLDPGTHVEIRGGAMAGVGREVGLTLHLATVPYVPMAASVQVSDWPIQSMWGVKMGYEAFVPLGAHADLGLRVTYAARVATLGGVGGGASLMWSF